MTIVKLASASSRLNDESVLRTDLDRTAEERSENEGMAEHAQKALDPIAWEEGRNQRSSGGDNIVSAHLKEREVRRAAPVETTDLERRVLVLATRDHTQIQSERSDAWRHRAGHQIGYRRHSN